MNKHILRTSLIILTLCLAGSVFGQKNILFVQFDTVHISASATPDDRDVVLGVHYHLQCSRPCKFLGFDARMVFEVSKIGIVKNADPKVIIADGSVSQGNDISNYDPVSGELRVEVLSTNAFDTTNHLLFRYRANVKVTPGDSALMSPILFDALKDIDTVIIENAHGRDDISWYPFVIAYGDTAIITPPKKQDIVLKIDSISLESDSTRLLTIRLSKVDAAKLLTGSFRCILDTSIVEVVSVSSASASVVIQNVFSGDTLRTNFASSGGPIQSGPLLTVKLHAKKRSDTVCTQFTQPVLAISNADNLVSTISYDLGSVCIYGQASDTAHNGVVTDNTIAPIVRVRNTALSIITTESNQDLRIFSVTGALVYSAILTAAESVIEPRLTNGVYIVVLKGKRISYRKPIVIVH